MGVGVIAINGQFTNRRLTGQERFAYEMVSALDDIPPSKNIKWVLVIPSNATNIPQLSNIEIVKFGKAKGSLWEQTCFAYYLITRHALSLNLCSIMPVLSPGIICIHDLSYKVNPQYFKTAYAKISQLWHKFQYHLAWRFAPIIFTVSEFSKRQMIDIYNVPAEKIIVIGNGWEHFKRISDDDTLLIRRPELFVKPFFFSLGSLAPNKNIEWILAVAKTHPQYNFYIAGNANLTAYGKDYKECDYMNVKFLGYLPDVEIKTLMRKCKAFIFPSLFEGFGIPPLEALSAGAKIIVAKSSCLPEIFEDSAYYINPYDTNINLDVLLEGHVKEEEAILKKYRFPAFAKTIHDAIMDKFCS